MEKPRRPGDPPRLIASSEKIKRELGWRPQFQTLDAIVDSAWKWHQNFSAVTKIDALIWGAQAADDCRLTACASQNLTRSDVTKKGARWRTSGRAILILFVAD